ncbi:MAG: N-acetyltransferase family protein [Actinobacteria bacterium]|nr:N-acetyltransferase family protein [Actinomycetota bacterium]
MIRLADAEAIAAIHNHGNEERSVTFETRPQRPEVVSDQIAHWKLVLVSEADGEINGFARAGSCYHYYDGIAEATVFVERSARGRGIGRELLAALIEGASERGLHKLTARVFAGNEAGLALFSSCGFRTVGRHERHGELEGEWLDVVLVERSL